MKLGSNDISAVKIGSTDVSKVYIGSTEVWTSFTGLLDTYTGAAAAYSLRLLSSTYTGDAIEVRRASDNTTQDIGFVNNELDVTSLESFCSGTNGFVTTWYDQSGNGYDATQTTAGSQPQIVSSGSVITENGKPAAQFDGSDDYILASGTIFGGGQYSAFVAVTPSSISQDSSFFQIGTASNNGLAAGFGGFSTSPIIGSRLRASTSVGASEVLSTTDMLLYSGIGIVSTATNNGYLNNTSMTGTTQCRSTSSPLSQLVLGSSGNSSFPFTGKLSDVIFYDSDESSNLNGINTNINDFYSIY